MVYLPIIRTFVPVRSVFAIAELSEIFLTRKSIPFLPIPPTKKSHLFFKLSLEFEIAYASVKSFSTKTFIIPDSFVNPVSVTTIAFERLLFYRLFSDNIKVNWPVDIACEFHVIIFHNNSYGICVCPDNPSVTVGIYNSDDKFSVGRSEHKNAGISNGKFPCFIFYMGI